VAHHLWWDSRILQRPDGSPAVWQRRCYDHNCRTPEIVVEKLKYCHDNPVKRGLVNHPEDWPWSSYNWYQGRRDGIFEIDGYEA
jgi:putative transposase